LERYGRELEKTGIVSEDIHRVLASYAETCLPLFGGTAKSQKEATQAFLRLFSTSQHFIFQGYNQSRLAASRRIDEAERQKLSRDLHDDIGHSLVMFKLYVEMIAKDLKEGNTSQLEQKLEEAKDLIGKAIDSIRRLILDLGPAILDEAGITPAIQLYARQFNVRTGIKVQVQAGDLPDGLPSGHEIALYRVFQGALSNVVKHSHAKHIKVTLGGAGKSKVVMTIEDDGVGFDTSGAKARSGFGLKAMRDRIESLGGRIHLESRPAKFGESRRGTRLEVDLPFPSDEER
jgi:signal transduction histidine kinase